MWAIIDTNIIERVHEQVTLANELSQGGLMSPDRLIAKARFFSNSRRRRNIPRPGSSTIQAASSQLLQKRKKRCLSPTKIDLTEVKKQMACKSHRFLPTSPRRTKNTEPMGVKAWAALLPKGANS